MKINSPVQRPAVEPEVRSEVKELLEDVQIPRMQRVIDKLVADDSSGTWDRKSLDEVLLPSSLRGKNEVSQPAVLQYFQLGLHTERVGANAGSSQEWLPETLRQLAEVYADGVVDLDEVPRLLVAEGILTGLTGLQAGVDRLNAYETQIITDKVFKPLNDLLITMRRQIAATLPEMPSDWKFSIDGSELVARPTVATINSPMEDVAHPDISTGMIAGNRDSHVVVGFENEQFGGACWTFKGEGYKDVNQDSVAVGVTRRGAAFMGVSDGMGGMASDATDPGGMSKVTIEEMYDSVKNWAASGAPLMEVGSSLRKGARRANRRVDGRPKGQDKHGRVVGQGATYTGVVAEAGWAVFANTGDSRGMVIDERGAVRFASKAHEGDPPQDNCLTHFIGTSGNPKVDLTEVELSENDVVMVFSDAITSALVSYEKDYVPLLDSGMSARKFRDTIGELKQQRLEEFGKKVAQWVNVLGPDGAVAKAVEYVLDRVRSGDGDPDNCAIGIMKAKNVKPQAL